MNKLKRRRMKKILLQNKIKIILILVVSFSLIITGAYAILRQNMNIDGIAKIEEETSCDLDVSADFKINATWGGSEGTTVSNATLTINNNSDEDINGWTIKIKGPSDLEVTANANITVDDNGVSTLTDLSWNGMINANGSIDLDLGLTTIETELNIEYIIFNDCKVYGTGVVDPDPEPTPDPDPIELTSLALSPSEYTMTIGEVTYLQVTKTPETATATLTFTSSDPNIVSVTEDGQITAVSKGTATITVSSGDISASSNITVEEQTIIVDNVNVTFEKTGYWGTETIQFKITIENNSGVTINKCTFILGMPDGTIYTFWSNLTNDGNTIISNNEIQDGNKIELYGELLIPEGYNPEDYLTPSVTEIKTE